MGAEECLYLLLAQNAAKTASLAKIVKIFEEL
jgi:hypothetical protein